MLCEGSEQPASPMTRAGTPATVLQYATSCRTTDPTGSASVCANAVLTIAATVATDAYAGFLKPRPQPHGPVCEIVLDDGNVSLGTLYIRCARATYNQVTSKVDGGPIPLLTRAWAFQERILSRRVLHFGYYRMALECKEDQRYQAFSQITTLRLIEDMTGINLLFDLYWGGGGLRKGMCHDEMKC